MTANELDLHEAQMLKIADRVAAILSDRMTNCVR
jgi:hypothetical protein